MDEVIYDLNTASEAELSLLPGMTPELLERIQGGRPYHSIEDLKHVKGISSKLYKKWQPALRVNGQHKAGEISVGSAAEVIEPKPGSELQAELPQVEPLAAPIELELAAKGGLEPALEATGEQPVVPEVPSPVVSLEILEPAKPSSLFEPVLPEEPEAVEPKTASKPPAYAQAQQAPAYVTRLQALLLVLLGSSLSFVLAVVVTLILLVVLNGGLSYAPLEEVDRIGVQIDQMQGQVSALEENLQVAEQKLSAVENKLGTVDVLASQVGDLQNLVDQVQADVRAATAMTEALREDVEVITQNVVVLQAQTQVFDNFLAGLGRLLESINEPVR